MTMVASIHGRIGQDPVERTTKSGSAMTTASVAVDVAGRDGIERDSWTMLADSVLTAASARPTGGKRRADGPAPGPARTDQRHLEASVRVQSPSHPFDDELPF